MKAQDPLTGEWKYFIDKCLPFGSSISCSHFQRFSNALQHLIEWGAQAQGRGELLGRLSFHSSFTVGL